MKQKLFTLLLAVAASVGTMFAASFAGFDVSNTSLSVLIQNTANVTVVETPAENYTHTVNLINGGEGTFTMGGITFSFTHEEAGKIAYKIYNTYIQPNGLDREIRIPTVEGEQVNVILTESCAGILVNGVSHDFFSGDNILTATGSSIVLKNSSAKPKISAILPFGSIYDEHVQIGDLYYNLDGTNQTAEVISSNSGKYSGNIVIPSSVTYNSVTYSVTSIGNGAFWDCTGLTSVTIPNSVTSIGEWAFENCTGLTSVTIPNSVTSIADHAFSSCSGLTSVTIPNSVTSIENYAFYGCKGLTSITIPNSVTSIGYDAFYGCTGLTSVTIPNSVTRIGNNAFYNCSGLTSVTIPNSVTSIGNYAFHNCYGLTSVTIPNSVTSIGNDAFIFCGGLTSIIVESGNTIYDSRQNCNAIIETATNTLIVGSANTVIPDNVTSIGDFAVYGCGLTGELVIPNSVTSIGREAFSCCSGLTSVTIGNSVTSIVNQAFYHCTGLTSVTIEAETPPTLGYQTFGWGTNCPFYVPCGTLDTYKTAWSDYASRIKYAPLPYKISTQAENGNVDIVSLENYTTCDKEPYYKLTASPNYGYHFTQWSDGNTDDPRTIVLASDTSFTAEFAKNTYTISTAASNPEWGTTAGDKSALYLDEIEISATANYGYHFVRWNDNNTSNPRTVSVMEDTTFTATFAKNVYSITKNAEHGTMSGNSSAEYLDFVTLTVTPDYGYHFTQWSDGNTDNPRTIVLTQDTSFTAEFAINNYTIETQSSLSEGGIILGEGSYEYLSQQTVTAIPNYGYHFVKWDIDDNTGAISAARAYAIASALGAGETTTVQYTIVGYVTGTYGTYYNSYYLSDSPNVPGNFIAFKCTSSVNIGQYVKVTGYLTNYKGNTPETTSGSAITPNDLSPFANPCSFTLRSNISFVAEFAKNVYSITKNAEHGTISGNTSAEYLDQVTLTANPEYGYHFAQWSDGNTENPRTIVLTQDTTFNAEFAIDKTGNCGDYNALIWTYDAETKTLTITGNGTLNSNYNFGIEAPAQMQKLVIGNEVTSIGYQAFYGMSTINHLIIGGSVATIGNYAFAECRNFDDITCLANVVPVINETTFANVGNKQYIYLFVPAERERAYHRDTYWGEFDIQVQQAEGTTVTTNDVTVEPQDNAATLTWPTSNNAASYTIEITKDGEVFCTLIFNGNGQLTGIAFAPGREGQAHAPAAIMTANGLQFTVTGLNSNTQYGYNLIAKDANNQPIATYSGEFTTTGEIATGIDNIQGNEVQSKKFVRNGQILILRGDKTYTLQGQEVK